MDEKNNQMKKVNEPDTFDSAVNFLFNTVGWIGQGLYDAGKAGVKFANDRVEDYQENQKLQKESARIFEEYTAYQARAIAIADTQAEQVKNFSAKVKQQQESIMQNQIPRLIRLLKYAQEVARINTLTIYNRDGQNLTKGISPYISDKFNKGASSVTLGVASGIGAMAGAFGLTSLFGTASTGVAISSLSGAASVSSTLATLGGGSLATGGLGMAGGAAVLGGIALVPAVAVFGYMWNKNIKEDYEKALKFKAEVKDKIAEAKKIYEQAAEAYDNLHKVSFITTNLKRLLDNLLNEFEKDIVANDSEESIKLVEATFNLSVKVLKLSVFNNDGAQNSKLQYEVENLTLAMERIQSILGYQIIRKNRPIPTVYKDYNIHPLKNEEIKGEFLNSFDKVQNELCIVTPWIKEWVMNEFMFKKFEELLRKKVKIKILYGYINKGKYDEETLKFSRLMTNRFSTYRNFSMKRTNTHVKLLICDDKYYLMGSYNFLSFGGDYTNGKTRDESIEYSEHPDMLKYYKDTYFQF